MVRSRLEQKRGKNSLAATAIEPCGTFTLAEDYHQKYYLRNKDRLMNALQLESMPLQKFIDSTLAARLNALAGRHAVSAAAVAEALREHSPSSPPPAAAQQEIDVMLQTAVKNGKRGPGC